MPRRMRRAISAAVVVAAAGAMVLTSAAGASARIFVSQSNVAVAGWGENPGLVARATWATILVNRDFTSTSGLGRTIFVDFNSSSTRCDTGTNDLITVALTTVDNMVGVPTDLVLTTTSAHYTGKLTLREITIVSHDCVAPGAPVITSRDLGTVQLDAEWLIGRRSRVHECTLYASPPPPTIALTNGWSSNDVEARMTLNGVVTLSFLPATQYRGAVVSTSTLGGIAAPRITTGCIPG